MSRIATGLKSSFLSGACLFTLAACGGGGGGSATGGGLTNTGGPVLSPALFETTEYEENYGLGTINAAEAYARSATGAGVTVAVVDTGIDTDHPDLAGNIDFANSQGFGPSAGSFEDDFGHGTAVAGVIAAQKNDIGVHGVAYDAEIMALKANNLADLSLPDTAIAQAIDHARVNGAEVINLSLGGAAPSPTIFSAIERATNAGIIVVAATGNDGFVFSPDYPARYAGDPALNGLLIATSSVDEDTNFSTFSSNCLTTDAAFCVAAPGEDIITTANGGGYTTVDGTSFAAPHVSGASAVLLDLFPTLTPNQVVEILTETAVDPDPAFDVDTFFGNGLIDLQAAVNPIGVLGLPSGATTSGGATALTGSTLTFGSAFGDAFSGQTVSAIAVDDYDRAYQIDLGDRLTAATYSTETEARLVPTTTGLRTSQITEGLTASLYETTNRDTAWRQNDQSTRFAAPKWGEAESEPLQGAHFSQQVSPKRTVSVGFGLSAETGVASLATGDTAALLGSATKALTGSARLVEPEVSYGVTQRFGPKTTVTAQFTQDTTSAGLPTQASSDAQRAEAVLSRQVGDRLMMLAGAAYTGEDSRFLGSEGNGVFDFSGGTASTFETSLGARYQLAPNTTAFGLATMGLTRVGDTQSVFNGFSPLTSSSFAAGIATQGVLHQRDRLAFAISQPLRIEGGTARFRLPVQANDTGDIRWDTKAIQAAPSGRQIDIELGYALQWSEQTSLLTWMATHLEPGHDRDAAPAHEIGLRLRIER